MKCGLCGVSFDINDETHEPAVFDVELRDHHHRPGELAYEEVGTLCTNCAHVLSNLFQRGHSGDLAGEYERCELCQRSCEDIRRVRSDLITETETIGRICPHCIGHLTGIFYGDTHYGPEIHGLPVVENRKRDEELGSGYTPSGTPTPCVYAIEANTGQVKIGRAKNAKKRLNGLQTGSPVELTLLAAGETNHADRVEAYLHRRYGKHRIRGEWFRLSRDNVIELIETIENTEVIADD
jgi:hypothetical protein